MSKGEQPETQTIRSAQGRIVMGFEKAFRRLIRVSAAAACIAAFVTPARAEDDAAKVLKAMTDYTAGQKSISATFDSDIKVITPELQKLQFTSSGQMTLSRPDKLRDRKSTRLNSSHVKISY